MIMDQVEAFVSEYSASEHFMFLSPEGKEEAEPMLLAFFRQAKDRGISTLQNLMAKDVEELFLAAMPRLNVSSAQKRAVPELLEGFFAFLKDTGRFPPAGGWLMCVESARQRYLASIREDGTVKGATFKKKYTDVGRNDPCPCGSGKKFKKCCMPLISGA